MIRILISLLIMVSTATLADGYNRKEWRHWIDSDKDCENTREEALKRDSLLVVTTTSACAPKYGVWHDPYTDAWFFDAGSLDADHIIPLKHANTYGGKEWSKSRKQDFANDPDNVIMVSASANRSKGAKAPNEWMPPNMEYHCEYLYNWVGLKLKYRLSVPQAESKFIKEYTQKYCS